MLMEEMATLERFQPKDPSINVGRPSSFEYFVKKIYRPKEDIEHVYQLTALAFIQSCDGRIQQQLIENPLFSKVLLTDIKFCLKSVKKIDPDYLRLAAKFQ